MAAPRNTKGTHRRRAGTADKRARALELRLQGMSLRRIAPLVGVASPQSVANLIEGALKDIPSPHVDAYRKEIDERSRELLAELVPIVTSKKRKLDDRLAAVDRIVRIDRELRQLHGLDAPVQTVSVTAEVQAKDVHQQLLDRLSRLAESVSAGESDPKPDAG